MVEAPATVFVHIVTHNHEQVIGGCLQAVLAERDSVDVLVQVTDNASEDGTWKIVEQNVQPGLCVAVRNENNLGFCGGHNQGVRNFLDSGRDFLLLLNPDCAVLPGSTAKLLAAAGDCLKSNLRYGAFCGKLLLANSKLEVLQPKQIDSTGIIFTASLRHFDRGHRDLDEGQFDQAGEVEGVSGAYLLMTRAFVEDLLLDGLTRETEVETVYPQLRQGRSQRALLFDEAFFAYREDAELALRARRYGWRFWYVPIEVGAHIRRVAPEERSELPAQINALGVRNRFLLQLLHFYPARDWRGFLLGFLFRNLVVVMGVCMREQSSARAFKEVWVLLKRAWERRKVIELRSIKR